MLLGPNLKIKLDNVEGRLLNDWIPASVTSRFCEMRQTYFLKEQRNTNLVAFEVHPPKEKPLGNVIKLTHGTQISQPRNDLD